jgi:hypothetical protein
LKFFPSNRADSSIVFHPLSILCKHVRAYFTPGVLRLMGAADEPQADLLIAYRLARNGEHLQ